jgi:hypothetical protein
VRGFAVGDRAVTVGLDGSHAERGECHKTYPLIFLDARLGLLFEDANVGQFLPAGGHLGG